MSLSYIEEELVKILQPMIHAAFLQDPTSENIFLLPENMETKSKIEVINNIKSFFKTNINKTSIGVIMSKQLHNLFSKILFRFLNDDDSNVRIASDECINLIIRLTTFSYSPYVIYNIFYELKVFQSSRSVKAALQKFSSLSSLIKYSKRVSYINNVLPTLKNILLSTDESILTALVKYLPKIAENLYSFSTDNDIEVAVLQPLMNNLEETDEIPNQRLLSQIIASTAFHMKNQMIYFEKLIHHYLNIDLDEKDENKLRCSIFIFKYLFLYFENIDNLNIIDLKAVLFKLMSILEMDYSYSLKNSVLDCLNQILSYKTMTILLLLNEKINTDDIETFKSIEQLLLQNLISNKSDPLSENEEDLQETQEGLTDNISLEGSSLISETDTSRFGSYQSLDINLPLLEIDKECEYLDYLPTEDENNENINDDLLKDDFDTNLDNKNENISDLFKLKSIIQSGDNISEHLIKIMITEFLFESIPKDSKLSFLNNRRCRTNCKILSINILQQILFIMPNYYNKELELNDIYQLPKVVDCVKYFCDDDDVQLNGAAFNLIGQIINKYFEQNKIDYNKEFLTKVQSNLSKVITGQQLKSCLSCVKQFLWNLTCSDEYDLSISIINTILQHSTHNYKLVKKEIIAILSQCINYENVLYYTFKNKNGLQYRKDQSISESAIDAMLNFIIDGDHEIREEACIGFIEMIDMGVFTEIDIFNCACRNSIKSRKTKIDSLTNEMKTLPFIDNCVDVKLSEIRQAHIKKSTECPIHNDIQAVHKAICLITEKLIEIPTCFTRETKTTLHKLSGYSHCLTVLLNTRKSQSEFPLPMDRIFSLLQCVPITSDIPLHSDLIYLSSKLYLLNSLPPNNSTTSHLPLLIHLCRVMNVYWHALQFITPTMPAHKTVIPSLVSAATSTTTSTSTTMGEHTTSKKQRTLDSPTKILSSSSNINIDSRPPRTKAALGFCVNIPLYTTLHRIITLSYSSSLVSPLDSQQSDRIVLQLLEKCVDSLTTLLDTLSFNDISTNAEEIISYATIFYCFIPNSTVRLIIRLLSALFGTNLQTQWDPFLNSIYQAVSYGHNNNNNLINNDVANELIEKFNDFVLNNGKHKQNILLNASVNNNNIQELDSVLTSLYTWTRAICKKREPVILKQISKSTTTINNNNNNQQQQQQQQQNTKPNLTHYIGLFEKIVFQCMRQYLTSTIKLQADIISLLCQLIHLRVNYCQLDSEQKGERKFMSIIINQLENANNIPSCMEGVNELIVTIVEFLILLTYERGGMGNIKNKPIITLTEVVRIIESVMASGINLRTVMIPCIWKLVCDLYVNRTVWLNASSQFNLMPTQESQKETDLLRETTLEMIMRKLLIYPETMEIMTLILEQSAREHEMKWEKVSLKVWSGYSKILGNNEIEISEKFEIDQFDCMIRLIQSKALIHNNVLSLIDLAYYEPIDVNKLFNQHTNDGLINHIKRIARISVCFNWVFIHNLEFWSLKSNTLSQFNTEDEKKWHFIKGGQELLFDSLKILDYINKNEFIEKCIPKGYIDICYECAQRMLLCIINLLKGICGDGQQSTIYKKHFKLNTIIQLFEESTEDIKNYLCTDQLKLLYKELEICILYNQSKQFVNQVDELCLSSILTFGRTKFQYNLFIQQCRIILEYIDHCEDQQRTILLRSVIDQNHRFLISSLDDSNVSNIVSCIYRNKDLSLFLLECIEKSIENENLEDVSYAMKWVSIIENVHVKLTLKLIKIIQQLNDVPFKQLPFIFKMKIDLVLVSRLEVFELSSDSILEETLKSLEKLVTNSKWTFLGLKMKLKEIKNNPIIMCDNDHINMKNKEISEDYLTGRNFWIKAINDGLSDSFVYQDGRLTARLLQGGTNQDLEEIFGVSLKDAHSINTNTSSIMKDFKEVNIPCRFIQQCIRLGFLRSGGGFVQEGVRVDVIFRLGEKLLFNKLNQLITPNQSDDNNLNPCSHWTLAMVTGLNEYFTLSCQLSIPMPLPMSIGKSIYQYIQLLCEQIIKEKTISQLLLKQLLKLITFCLSSSFNLLSDEEGLKSFYLELTDLNDIKSIIYMIYYLITPQYKIQSQSIDINLLILYCFNQLSHISDSCCTLCAQFRNAILTIIRLPCIFPWIRYQQLVAKQQQQQQVKSQKSNNKKFEVDLNCLSELDRDELLKVESQLSTLGWLGRHMFEETWLLYLGLLHDDYQTEAAIIEDGDEAIVDVRAPEEIVELGHCDSIGLMGLSNLLLKTTLRPYPGNPVCTQLEHKPRDKTPFLLHTKIGRKLSHIHAQLEEEIFQCLHGFKMLYSGWTFSSWNLECNDSILQYRHEQININILAKRISMEGRSPQISGNSDYSRASLSGGANEILDIVSCLQSLPIILEQWLQPAVLKTDSLTCKSRALWPRACALRAAVMMMDLFSSRDQVQWLLDTLLNMIQFYKMDDDWIFSSWCCVGLSKCVAVLESSKIVTSTLSHYHQQHPVTVASITGLLPAIKLAEFCLQSDITCLQQAALYASMSLLQMTVQGGKNSWECASGSLTELHTFFRLIMNHLELMLNQLDPAVPSRRESFVDATASLVGASVANLSQSVTTRAANLANSMSSLSSVSLSSQSTLMSSNASNSNQNTPLTQPNQSSTNISTTSSWYLPKLTRNKNQSNTTPNINSFNNIRSEKHNLLVMATACFFCERYPDALQDSDLLNNFVNIAKNILQTPTTNMNNESIYNERMNVSNKFLLTLCRCIERILLTQRASNIVIEQIIRICSGYLRKCRSSSYSLSVLGLFITSCYMSLTNNTSQPCIMPASFESIFHCSPANWSPESQPIILERMNLLWKRLIDPESSTSGVCSGNFESRILSRTISSVMIEFLAGSEMLNKTIHQLLRSWPHSQYVAKSLFDMIVTCLNQPEGQKEIRKWILMVLPSLVSSTPEILSVWSITVVLVACTPNTRTYLRSLFSVCLDWLVRYERSLRQHSTSGARTPTCSSTSAELEDLFCLAALSFLQDLNSSQSQPAPLSNDVTNSTDDLEQQKSTFIQCIQSRINHVTAFHRFYQLACDNQLV